jgi:hypothetical protein
MMILAYTVLGIVLILLSACALAGLVLPKRP